jgi:hypothetical protein
MLVFVNKKHRDKSINLRVNLTLKLSSSVHCIIHEVDLKSPSKPYHIVYSNPMAGVDRATSLNHPWGQSLGLAWLGERSLSFPDRIVARLAECRTLFVLNSYHWVANTAVYLVRVRLEYTDILCQKRLPASICTSLRYAESSIAPVHSSKVTVHPQSWHLKYFDHVARSI